MTLKTGVMMPINQLCHHNKLYFKLYLNRKVILKCKKMYKIKFTVLQFFYIYFESYKCSLGEQNRLKKNNTNNN